MPLALNLHCPRCGTILEVKSQALCSLADAHSLKCRPVIDRCGLLVAEHAHTQTQHKDEYYSVMARQRRALVRVEDEKLCLTKRVAELEDKELCLTKRVTELTTRVEMMETSGATIVSLQNENAALRAECHRLRAMNTPANQTRHSLVRALRCIVATPARRRKLLALLHPDFLKDPALCAHAKVVREAVELG